MNEIYELNIVINGTLEDIAKVRELLGVKMIKIVIESNTYNKVGFHETQTKILSLIEKMGLKRVEALKLRQVGELVGVEHPQKIKHHMEQLKKRGLWVDFETKQPNGEGNK